jgi:hypothetical protein
MPNDQAQQPGGRDGRHVVESRNGRPDTIYTESTTSAQSAQGDRSASSACVRAERRPVTSPPDGANMPTPRIAAKPHSMIPPPTRPVD